MSGTGLEQDHGEGTAAALTAVLEAQLERLRREAKYKREVVITTPQRAHIGTDSGRLLNLGSNTRGRISSRPSRPSPWREPASA